MLYLNWYLCAYSGNGTLKMKLFLCEQAWTGLSDVYIQATIGDSSSKSETVWNTAAPAWKHDMNLWVQKGEENSSLVLSLWDEDLLNRADPLGSVTVQLSTLEASTKTDFHLPLTGTGNSGCVKFSATFLPFGDVAGGGVRLLSLWLACADQK